MTKTTKQMVMAVAAFALAAGSVRADVTTNLDLVTWDFQTAQNTDVGGLDLLCTLLVRNRTGRTIKMIRGDVTLKDPVGNIVGYAQFNPDVDIADGAIGQLVAKGGAPFDFKENRYRISTIDHSLVQMDPNIIRLMFADGEVSKTVIFSPVSQSERDEMLKKNNGAAEGR